jgi:hypothetical protein
MKTGDINHSVDLLLPTVFIVHLNLKLPVVKIFFRDNGESKEQCLREKVTFRDRGNMGSNEKVEMII